MRALSSRLRRCRRVRGGLLDCRCARRSTRGQVGTKGWPFSIEQRVAALDLKSTAPDHHDRFAELDAHHLMAEGDRIRTPGPALAKRPAGVAEGRCFDAARITAILQTVSAVRRTGWLAFAPNRREPRLLMPRQSRRAVVMAYLHKAGRGDVIAPSVDIEEAGIAVVAQTLLVIPSRI